MALITCPECGKKISDQAQNCPNCGCPICGVNNLQELVEDRETMQQENKTKKLKITLISLIVVGFLAIVVGVVYYQSTDLERSKKALNESRQRYDEAKEEVEDIQKQIDENQRLIDKYK